MRRLRLVLVGVGSLLSSWAWAQSSASRWDAKTLRLTGSTSGYVGFQAPASAGNTTYTWPSSDGTNGQVLTTNGSGALTWTTASGGGSSAWTSSGGALFYNSGFVGIGTSSPSSLFHVAGTVTATDFSGSGASLTSLNASNLASGTVSTARLGSGTASSSTFLRGDGAWAAPTVTVLSNVTTLKLANGGSSGSCSSSNAGEIRWNGTEFEGCNGSKWLKMIGGLLGEASNPATTCKALLLARPGIASGLYWLDPDGAGVLTAFQAYCDMTLSGGGWTLISNRRGNANNNETCGNNVSEFFTSGCGDPTWIGYTNSYSMTAANRNALLATEMLMIQYDSAGVADTVNAFIVTMASAGQDLFPTTTQLQNIAVTKVCPLSGDGCDSLDVYWKYAGSEFFAYNYCNSGLSTAGYGGVYGVCSNGVTSQYTSNSLIGSRSGYDESKLWGHSAGNTWQERILFR